MTDDPGAGTPGRDPVRPVQDVADRNQEFSLFYKDQLLRLVAFLMVGHGVRRDDAYDIAQATMVDAYRSWDSIDHPRAWVRGVAVRIMGKRPKPTANLAEEGLPAAQDTAEEIETIRVFLPLLDTLPPLQRQVMAWTYDGYRPTEIAAALGLPAVNIRSALRDARAALRKRYPPEETP